MRDLCCLQMPRKKKSVRVVSSPIKPIKAPNRPAKLRNWKDEAMTGAIEAVKEGMGVNCAAKEFGVPATTLRNRLSGRVTHGTNPGPKPYLSSQEEDELAAYLTSTSKAGYGKTRRQVMNIVQHVAKEKRILRKERISSGWFRRFRERQPDVSLRKGDSMALVRFRCTDKETIDGYYDLLETVMEENNLRDKPGQLYNIDETGMPLDPPKLRVCAKKGQKKVRQCGSGNKAQITVVSCGSATGHVIPPFVIFEGKNFNHQWSEGEVPGTMYGTSPKGWIDTELFKHWFTDHFLRHAPAARPLLLLMDGHSSHYQPEVIRKAKENGVEMLCFPPHTTADSQPLDVGVFGPLKVHWRNICHEWVDKNPNKVITKFTFSSLFHKAWLQAMTPANLIAGFKKAGVYPLNRQAIPVVNENDVTEQGPSDATERASTPKPSTEETLVTPFTTPGPSVPSTISGNQFTADQLAKFQRRFDEGYDILTEPEYVEWLKINHPDFLSTDHDDLVTLVAEQFSYVTPLEACGFIMDTQTSATPSTASPCVSASPLATPSTASPCVSSSPLATPSRVSPSVSASRLATPSTASPCVSSLPLATPSRVSPSVSASPLATPSRVSPSVSASPLATPSRVSPSVSASPLATPSRVSPSVSASPLATPSRVSPCVSASPLTTLSTPISSVVSKYLVSTPKSRGTIVRTGARVLTSAESMRLLEEKEALKRRQAEEKEQRKLEREEKKKKKEEEKKQKAEARVSKAAERLAKQGQKGRRGPKRKAPAITRNDDTVNNDNAENEDSDEHSSGAQPVRKKTRGVNEHVCEKSTIDTNLCCVCYIYYQEDVAEANGRNWIACSCGRWLHEDCALIEPEMIATSEEFCPECVM